MFALVVVLVILLVYCVRHKAEPFKGGRRRPYVACAQGACPYCRSGTYAGITNSSGNYCCPNRSTDSGWFPHADSAASFWGTRDYCTGLPVGQPCVTDAMCGDGSPGSCSGIIGWSSGVCVNKALEAQCTDIYNQCVGVCDSNSGWQPTVEAGGEFAVCLAECDAAVSKCRLGQ